jgi:hypothetical protein
MLEWTLKPGEPGFLPLAADVRLGATDYVNDQIWELVIGRSEPPAITLQTTCGLRARSLRIFPRFGEGDLMVSDPAQFQSAITIQCCFPNYVRLAFSPLTDLQVEADFWVPDSQSAGCRLLLSNPSSKPRTINLEVVGVLNPDAQGERLALVELQAATVMTGKTNNLAPVIYLTGGAQPSQGPFTALATKVELPAKSQQKITWIEAALGDADASFKLAKRSAARNWDAEIARLELFDAGLVEIHTGEPGWDHAFALSQRLAYGLLAGPTSHLPHPSFVISRQPDRGYSLRGDGSDYSHLWNGQSPFEAYYLYGLLLPAAPELVRGIFMNFLAAQTEDGAIDLRPGLGGQRTQLLATPLLASLAWRIYEFTGELHFLEQAFLPLVRFLKRWQVDKLDGDRDGVPEWEHAFQTGLDNHPLFDRYFSWAQGLDITKVESPDLSALLYRECSVLLKMARLLHRREEMAFLRDSARRYKAAVEASWNEADACYHYRDRDSHDTTDLEVLGSRMGSGELAINKLSAVPARLSLRIEKEDASTRRVLAFLHGSSLSGAHRVERISTEGFNWSAAQGFASSERTYREVEHIEVQGLKENDRVTVYYAGLSARDVTNLLPLWAEIPTPERARKLVQKTILNPQVFWSSCGIRLLCDHPPEAGYIQYDNMSPAWNALISEGLLAYAYRSEAAEVVSRIMNTVAQSLEQTSSMHQAYQAETGSGVGEHNALPGLAPVGLFLDTLGVKIINPKQILIEGINPFPWPVTVKYRGTTILRQKEKTTVIFFDGQTITTDKISATTITLA